MDTSEFATWKTSHEELTANATETADTVVRVRPKTKMRYFITLAWRPVVNWRVLS